MAKKMNKLKLYNIISSIKSAEQLKAILPDNLKGFCILEYQDENKLIYSKNISNIDDLYSGKVLKMMFFNNEDFINLEKKSGSEFNIVTNIQLPNEDLELKELEFSETLKSAVFILWGEYNKGNDRYFENIVPKFFNYPVTDKKEHVIIEATKYQDKFGNTLFYRYNSLKGLDL